MESKQDQPLENYQEPQSSEPNKLYDTVHLLDERLQVKSNSTVGVFEGAQSVSTHVQNAATSSSSGITWNVNVPSMSTIVSRVALVKYTMNFTVKTNAAIANGAAVLTPANVLAPSDFPLHRMASSISVTINDQTLTQDHRQIHDIVSRMYNTEMLKKYTNLAPVERDYFQTYANSAGSQYDVLSNNKNNKRSDFYPRGYFVNITNNLNAAGGAAVTTANVALSIVEPVLISPFLLNEVKDCGGMYGIQQLNLNYNLSGNYNRSLKLQAAIADRTIAFTGFSQYPELILTYLTPKPSLALNPRCVTPYWSFKRLTTVVNNTINVNTSQKITSNTVTLNHIPDYMMIGVRDQQVDDMAATKADYLLPIRGVSISFNNQVGLLSNVSDPSVLWKMSSENGSSDDYPAFYGSFNTALATATSASNANVSTCGGMLVLKPGKDFAVPEEYYSNGSLGSFNFQLSLDVFNNTGANVTTQEIVIVTATSGILVNEMGQSSSYLGMLNKRDVLNALQKPPLKRPDRGQMNLARGGAWWSGLKETVKKVGKGFSGGGYSAGGYSAGASSSSGHSKLFDRLKM